MVLWSYSLATGVFLFGGACDPEHDPATEWKVRLLVNPDLVRHRINRAGVAGFTMDPAQWVVACGVDANGVALVRLATPAELAAVDDGAKTVQASDRMDDLALRAVGAFVLQELNVIRAALVPPKPALTASDLRTFVVAYIKARL